jgi:hypothetical protein
MEDGKPPGLKRGLDSPRGAADKESAPTEGVTLGDVLTAIHSLADRQIAMDVSKAVRN